ncbi:hypothetical protein C8T65DRAFT_580244 [Cerioporus squamosus]|nr:hypothetical protein C8T65DRAFT_580244 [Cerioporus squamosus]
MDPDTPSQDVSREEDVSREARKVNREEAAKGNANASAQKVRKLVPPRPFPTVPASVSATGPRSAHIEGKNYFCITRRTELGAYLRRCKDVFIKDGYKTLHLSAMGAAIPHLMQLALSLPPILPFPQDEIRTEILTGSVEVQDEVIPHDEDEDISYRTRGKSTVSVVIRVGDGVDEPAVGPARGSGRKNKLGRGGAGSGSAQPSTKTKSGGKGTVQVAEQIVIREDEMDET